jgi:hypothetical protein
VIRIGFADIRATAIDDGFDDARSDFAESARGLKIRRDFEYAETSPTQTSAAQIG